MYIEEDGQQYAAELQFATLSKTDDQSEVEVQGPALNDLCRIEVRVYRGVQQSSRSRAEETWSPTKDVGKVLETELMLGSTVVAGARSDYPLRMTSDFILDQARPHLCTFVWQYHTRDKLVIMGVINDPPKPLAARLARRKRQRPPPERLPPPPNPIIPPARPADSALPLIADPLPPPLPAPLPASPPTLHRAQPQAPIPTPLPASLPARRLIRPPPRPSAFAAPVLHPPALAPTLHERSTIQTTHDDEAMPRPWQDPVPKEESPRPVKNPRTSAAPKACSSVNTSSALAIKREDIARVEAAAKAAVAGAILAARFNNHERSVAAVQAAQEPAVKREDVERAKAQARRVASPHLAHFGSAAAPTADVIDVAVKREIVAAVHAQESTTDLEVKRERIDRAERRAPTVLGEHGMNQTLSFQIKGVVGGRKQAIIDLTKED